MYDLCLFLKCIIICVDRKKVFLNYSINYQIKYSMRGLKVERMIRDEPNRKIFKGRLNDPVFVKEYKNINENEVRKKNIEREIHLLHSLKHKNIVKLQDVFQNKVNIYLVFELIETNLLQIIDKDLNAHLVAKYAYEILQGLQYIHALNFIHRNLTPQNILVPSQGCIKICDLTNACTINEKITKNPTKKWYKAPQILVGYSYSQPIDIWSLGCIIAQLVLCQPLFPGVNEMDQLSKICFLLGQLPATLKMQLDKNIILRKINKIKVNNNTNTFYEMEKKIGIEGVDLIKKMLDLNPMKRITASQAKKHNFFKILKNVGNQNEKKVSNWLNIPETPLKDSVLKKWYRNIELSLTSRTKFYKKILHQKSQPWIQKENQASFNLSKTQPNKTFLNFKHFFNSNSSLKRIKPQNIQKTKLLNGTYISRSQQHSKQNHYTLLFEKLASKNRNFRSVRGTALRKL